MNVHKNIPILFFSICSPLVFYSHGAYSETLNEKKKDVNFDIKSLESLGYGSEVAEFFKKGSQFLPGKHDVTINLNNNNSYSVVADINEEGELCLDNTLQTRLGLKNTVLDKSCNSFQDIYPDAKIKMLPNNFEIQLVVSENDIDQSVKNNERYYGGFGIMSNYRLYGMQNSGVYNNKFYQGEFESGINWENWVLRNNSSFSTNSESSEYQFNETTLAKSIESLNSQFEIGQITSQGLFYGGVPINGVQLYSDSSLQANSSLVTPIVGIANSSSTVEVEQNGRLLYRTIVPAGPFELKKINNVVSGSPLNVTVIQDNGEKQTFQVVTYNVISAQSTPLSYQLVLGKYRKSKHQESETPLIGSFETNFQHNHVKYLTGFLYSDDYQSLSAGAATQLGKNNNINLDSKLTESKSTEKSGSQFDGSASMSLDKVSFGTSFLYRSNGYPTLYDTLDKQESIENDDNLYNQWFQGNELKTSSSLFTSFGDIYWGRINYSLNVNNYYGNKKNSVSHTISYGQKIANVSLNLSFQSGNDRDNRFFLNASMPISSRQSISLQEQYYQNSSTVMANYSHNVSDSWRYSLGAGRTSERNQISGNVTNNNSYSTVTLSGMATSDNYYSYMASASGGIAYSNGLIATSSAPLGNTFGIVYIPEQSNIKVNALGSGTTITNHFGTAAISSLPENSKSTVYLNTNEAPVNVRLDTTSFDINVAKGSVFTREIKATVMKQLLLHIVLKDGKIVPTGANILDEKGNYLTSIMGDGNILISNEQIGKQLILRSPNKNDCVIEYNVPEVFSSELIYEEEDAVCL